jgi:hypothetical protein
MAKPLFVNKDKSQVVIFTASHRIEGEIHVYSGSRLTDFMEAKTNYGFMAVTNATVFPLSGDKALYSVRFLNVNKNFVVMIVPKGDCQ